MDIRPTKDEILVAFNRPGLEASLAKNAFFTSKQVIEWVDSMQNALEAGANVACFIMEKKLADATSKVKKAPKLELIKPF